MPLPTQRSLGDVVFHLRRELGITQSALARRCGLSQCHVSRIEADEFKGQVPIERLAKVFHVSADAFPRVS